ncbi:MAG: hypothetical protein AAB389_00645 [Patescibacteria group bacterium]
MFKHTKIFISILAIFVGLLYVAPQLLIRRKLIADGKPFVLSQFFYTSDEAHNYLQRNREVYDGGFPPKDLFFDGDRPNIFPILPAIIFTPYIWFFSDLNLAYLALSFDLSALMFLAFFGLGWVISEKKYLWSIFLGLFGALTPAAIHMPRAFLSPANFSNIVVKNFYPGISTLLDRLFLNRMDDPLITFLIYIPAITLLIAFWKNPSRNLAIAAGLVSGLLFYVYFHYWVYWAIVLGLILAYLFLRRRMDPSRWKLFLILFGIFILMSAPYWINYLRFSSLPGADEYAQRIGIETGRFLRIENAWPDYLAYLALAAAIYLVWWRRGNRNLAILGWIFIAAVFIAWNVNIVTGFVPQPGHWRKAVSPVYFALALMLIYEFFRKIETKKAAIILLGLSLLLVAKKVVNVLHFVNPPEQYLRTYTQPRDLVDSWSWINENLPKEASVAGLSFQTSIKLSAFTSLRPFLPWSGITPATNLEIEERYLATNKAFGVSAAAFEARLRKNIDDDHLNLYTKLFSDRGIETIPDEKISDLVRRYQLLASTPLVGEPTSDVGFVSFSSLGVDYVYYGPEDQKIYRVDLSGDKNLELVYQNGGVEIYRTLNFKL